MINQYAVAPTEFGGTRHFDFAKELAKRDVKTTILASSFNNYLRKETRKFGPNIFLKEKIQGVDFIWIKSPAYRSNGLDRLRNMFSFCRNLRLTMNKIKEKPGIIIGSSPHLFAAYFAMRFAKKNGIKFIFEIRDIWPLTLIDLGKSTNHPMIRILSVLEKRLVLGADKIIVLMPKGSDYLVEKFKITKEKIVWISNGVNLENFPRMKRQKQNTNFTLAYTGTIGEANDLECIVQAAKILQQKKRKIFIKLYGDGVSKQKVQKQIKDLSLRNISLEKPVPKKEVYKIIRSHDALLLTVKKAGVYKYGHPPNKIFDYLSSEKPIIFASGAANDLVKESKSGISVEPSNPKKLASAIEKLSKTKPNELRAMGRRGRKLVENNYQIKTLSAVMYDSIVKTINDL